MSRLYRYALATVLATLALVVFGSLARLHPAGSGCGNDWPLCNGSWLPSPGWASLVEYLHRGIALAVLAFAAATAFVAFRTPEASGRVRLLASAGLAAIICQSLIGGLTAAMGAPTTVATLHLIVAMLFAGFAVATLAAAASLQGSPGWLAQLGRAPAPTADRSFALVASLGATIAFLLLLFGASTSATGAFACATWPLCADGSSSQHGESVIHLGYRASALLGTLATGAAAFCAWRRRASRTARILATTAVGLVVAQSVLNATAAALGDPAWASAPHLAIATLLWMVMLGVMLAAWGPRPEYATASARASEQATASAGRPTNVLNTGAHASGTATLAVPAASLEFDLAVPPLRRVRQIVADYVALTKPGIMSLLLVTTFCAMLMAERGLPPFWLVVVTLLGGVLASGGANVLNCYIDRDIDGQMSRTRNRAIVAGRVSPEAALAYGIALTGTSVLLLGLAVNWLAAALALAGNLFYVLVYTKWLKRSTPYNIVIGGAAGAAPPLVGWAAVTGDLTPLAWGLFLIVFAWTPPHFWALALLKQGDYTRAAVPMLPVVRGEAETRRQIVFYTVVLAAVCLALTPLGLGPIYLAAAIALNGIFLGYALWLYVDPSKKIARQMFFYSLWYLALLFAAAVIDRLVIA
jgi:protoheme IX farnesyltransferase